MATTGFINGGAFGSSWIRSKDSKMKAVRNNDGVNRVFCVSSGAATRDPYKTLMVKPGASKSEVKKAFRRLALRVISLSIFCLSFRSFIILICLLIIGNLSLWAYMIRTFRISCMPKI